MPDVNAQMISFPSNTHTTPGYMARPDDMQVHPGVVVLQEWWGLTPHIKEIAGRLAEAGFIALAPDLYHGRVADEPDEARKLAMNLDIDRAHVEIRAAAAYLQSLAQVSPKRIGVIGWCMGGAAALGVAANSGHVDFGAVVAFYGRPPAAEQVTQIDAPVLGLYGEDDGGIPVSLVQTFEEALATNDIPHEIHIYEGAGHAFFNDTRPSAYHADAAQDAWQQTLSWFRRYLSGR